MVDGIVSSKELMLVCPTCQSFFRPSGRRRFCSDACRRMAWDRQHRAESRAAGRLVARSLQPPLRVYGCAACGARAAGDQHCVECGNSMVYVGLGGSCPHCHELVAVADLIAGEVMPASLT